jgi:ribosomal protein S18 acetylase RimI-like enzyme
LDEGDCLLVVNVAVGSERQGKGLGSKLLEHAEEIARSLGRQRIRLFTNKLMTENIKLYQRLGYTIDLEADVGGGTLRVDMSKAAP